MSADLYEFTVEWPTPDPQSVVVTGDFDQWSQSLHISRDTSSNTYSTTIKVPYGCPTRYKFIVDGQWRVVDGKPTEFSQEGHLNNIHYVPLENPNKPKPLESKEPEVKVNGSASHSNLVSTIAASEGTSSALQYVASGLGVTIQSVVGVDPINPNQIPLTTPTSPNSPSSVPLSTTTTEDPESNSNNMENNVTSNTTPHTQSPNDLAADNESTSPVAPIVPITIVPVYAKENCTIDPSKPSLNENEFTAVGMPRIKKAAPIVKETEVEGEEVVSTHAAVVPPIVVISSDDEPEPSYAVPVVGELGSTVVNPVEKEKEIPVLAALQSAPPAVVEQHEEELKKIEDVISKESEEKAKAVEEGELKEVEAAVISPPGLEAVVPAETVEANSEVDQKPEDVTANAEKEALPATKIPLPETPATNASVDKDIPTPTPAQIPLPVTPATNVDADTEKAKAKEPVTPTPAQVPLPETPAKSPAVAPATNGHQKSLSADTTKTDNDKTDTQPVPVTPTKKGEAASSSTTTTPFSTTSKKRFPSFGAGSPSKDGNGTVGSRNSKRKSSIFGKIKEIFHHEKKAKGDSEKVAH